MRRKKASKVRLYHVEFSGIPKGEHMMKYFVTEMVRAKHKGSVIRVLERMGWTNIKSVSIHESNPLVTGL